MDVTAPDFVYDEFSPSVQLIDVAYRYPGSDKEIVKNINLEIKPGHVTAIVGPSGSGKSTLLDLILGVLVPTKGTIRINSLEPAEAIKRWPGSISYVPQVVNLTNASVVGNITRGFENGFFTDDQIQNAINFSQLSTFQNQGSAEISAELGFSGSRLSGGQRQRVGIAHAIITAPRLLVLDEATSALDGETEESIKQALQLIRGKVSILIVAHRLSTVRNADQVVYLRDGEIQALGSFEEVRAAVPDFDKQAQLMGL